jgi:ribonuclease VapC
VIETRFGEVGGRELDLLVHRARIEIASVDAGLTDVARAAFRKWGKGRHPAALNFGDCFSYALAKATGLPLLFKGDDFTHTDIEPAL